MLSPISISSDCEHLPLSQNLAFIGRWRRGQEHYTTSEMHAAIFEVNHIRGTPEQGKKHIQNGRRIGFKIPFVSW